MSSWPTLNDLPSFTTLPVNDFDKISETGKYPLGPEAAFPSRKKREGGIGNNSESRSFREVSEATRYLGDSIKESTSTLMNRNKKPKLPITYKFTFCRMSKSTSTLLMEDQLHKKMKDVMGELSKTDVSGVFAIDQATKAALGTGSKVWEIKIEGEETPIPKANFDDMSASSLFGLTNNNRVTITLKIVERVAAPTNNYSW